MSLLHSFGREDGDGRFPIDLSVASDGSLYGMTHQSTQDRNGVIFRLVPTSASRFLRGECNDDGEVDLSDAVCILEWLFSGAAVPGCVAATNVNGDGETNIVDAIYLLSSLFLGGAAPAKPFRDCGPGPLGVDELLGCATPPGTCH